ncbi:DUF5996 family protein [Sphingomicrobium clamense]|uniref:Ava_C0101 and related proteins n=1 Tax=Sphingomicrobium clamense TaxID=2851013 RepID=A0ABS6V2W9_9SPHN|nr:DUF5996 family protein [Sphingomicrobium sp. B8]MBW0143907.1 hypothetical protein [Sphingomicrobium sp. B8]
MDWPRLGGTGDHETLAILHLASQLVGKLKVAHSPWVNHGWHLALHPVPEGLAMQPIDADGRRFTLTLDLCRHVIALKTNNGTEDAIELAADNIATLHRRFVSMLERHGLPSRFHHTPNEVENAVRFSADLSPRSYDPEVAARFREALVAMVPVFDSYRAGFTGKSSPTHFFWGSFDLAVTRFSGRDAPEHPGGVPGLPDRITREAYSDEVESCGFWGGGVVEAEPFFYAYAYPQPDQYRQCSIAHGKWSDEFGEWVLPYDEVRSVNDPAAMLDEFLDSAYRAAADTGEWERERLERKPVAP